MSRYKEGEYINLNMDGENCLFIKGHVSEERVNEVWLDEKPCDYKQKRTPEITKITHTIARFTPGKDEVGDNVSMFYWGRPEGEAGSFRVTMVEWVWIEKG